MEIFQDKDAKISFLQKAIDVVMMVSGEPLSAKPARIVAGHEPEKTNELLQLIGKCCLNKVGGSLPFEACPGRQLFLDWQSCVKRFLLVYASGAGV